MVEMKELEWEERDRLYKGIAALGVSYEAAKKIFARPADLCVIEVDPPQAEGPSLQAVEICAMHTGRFHGRTYKPGNIILNIQDETGEFLAFGASVAASIGALSASQPIVACFTILAAILSVAALGKKQLDDDAALILAVLWEDRDRYGTLIDRETGYELVDQYLKLHGREGMSKSRYEDLLEDLDGVGSIEQISGKIRLKERIHITY